MVNTNQLVSEIIARWSKPLVQTLILLIGFFPATQLAQEGKDPLSSKQRREFNELFFEAEKNKNLGNVEGALLLYEKLIDMDANNDAVSFELAQIYASQSNQQDAVYFAENAVALDGSNPWYLLLLAKVYGGFSLNGQQVEALEKLVALDTNNPDYRYELALAYLKNDQAREAIFQLDELQRKMGINEIISDQKKSIYLELGELENAAKEIKALIEANPRNVDYYGSLARLYRANDRNEEAFNIFKQMIEIAPDDPRVHLDLAQYYRDFNQFDSSIYHLGIAMRSPELDLDQKVPVLLSLFELAANDTNLRNETYEMLEVLVEQNDQDPKAFALYGDFLSRDGFNNKALKAYKKAVSLEGGSRYQIWEQILLIEIQTQAYDSLLVSAPKAVELYPNQPLPYLFAGIAYSFNKQPFEAAGFLEDGLVFVLGNQRLKEQFYAQLAAAYHELGESEKSDSYFDKALAINPKNESALNNYAYYLSVRKVKLDKALEMSAKSNALSPGNATFIDTWAWILYQQEKYAEALEKIEEAVKFGGGKSSEILEHYGDILLKNGRNSEAIEQYQKAMQLGGNKLELEKKINAIGL